MDREKIRKKNDIIQDTSAGEMILDTSKKDDNVNKDGVMDIRLNPPVKPDSVVFSMRMKANELEHFKQIARVKAVKEKRDIGYQQLITEAALQIYPLENGEE